MIDFSPKKRKSLGRGHGFETVNPEDQKVEKIFFRVSKKEKNFINNYCLSKNLKKSDLIRHLLSDRLTIEFQNPLFE